MDETDALYMLGSRAAFVSCLISGFLPSRAQKVLGLPVTLLGKEVIPALREHRSALATGKEVTPWPQ